LRKGGNLCSTGLERGPKKIKQLVLPTEEKKKKGGMCGSDNCLEKEKMWVFENKKN